MLAIFLLINPLERIFVRYSFLCQQKISLPVPSNTKNRPHLLNRSCMTFLALAQKSGFPLAPSIHSSLLKRFKWKNTTRSSYVGDLANPLKGQPGNIGASEGSLVAIEARVGGQESVLRPFD